ncbi:DUF494 family protein [Legionella fairfieldensis]|uniref:DUF494 family protein n=1 Tax=Legionella fairfieldensis TaxID=45064 RepID=UPI00048B7098|nr:DUF494 family protein [Legionella fairfieldensis]
MKDSLFEILMNFFTKSLSQLKENSINSRKMESDQIDIEADDLTEPENRSIFIKSAQNHTIRIFTDEEKIKLTKASYQFLTRLMQWGIIAPEVLESIINQLLFSESRFVSLQETKWVIRNLLAENLDSTQLAFLDLVLYHKEDKLTLH